MRTLSTLERAGCRRAGVEGEENKEDGVCGAEVWSGGRERRQVTKGSEDACMVRMRRGLWQRSPKLAKGSRRNQGRCAWP